jgi:hypothetical protein
MSKFFNALAVAVLGIALLMGAASAETASVTGNVISAVQVSAGPTGATNLQLDPAATPKEQTDAVTVKSTTAWKLDVSDADTSNTNGFMKEWTGSAYASAVLANAMQIKYGAAYGTTATLPTAFTMASGSTATGDSGQAVNFKYSQPVSYGDAKLTSNVYRIVVTFTVTNT